jgi:FkbM family methyltransferase
VPDLKTINVDGLKFAVRPNTSDMKAINEVVSRGNYGRYNFAPAVGEHWIDLGANIGAFTVWAASRHAYVQAYEPDGEMCDLIERNVALNGQAGLAEIFQSAVVADRRRSVTLHRNSARGNLWRSSIEREWRGGDDVVVPTCHISRVLRAAPNGSYLKMDVEGTEMPLLEWMLDGPNVELTVKKLQGMVFEWSFDVDPSIPRFRNVIARLQKFYTEVRNFRTPDGVDLWPSNWQPPCRVIWAWNE